MGSRGLIRNFIASFRMKKNEPIPKQVGSDHLGNDYFEAEGNKNSEHRHLQRTRRFVKVPGQEKLNAWGPEGAPMPELPREWESWLRSRRIDPPKQEELDRNLAIMKRTQAKAAELEEKYKQERIQLVKEGVIADTDPEEHKKNTTGSSYPALKGYEHYPGAKEEENNPQNIAKKLK